MAWIFALTLFVSATLLFLLQPMMGRLLLPKFGGSPGVWATCMLFFQSALLAGYAYAHVTPSQLGIRRQALLHVGVLLLPLLLLPLGALLLPFAELPLGLAPEWAPPGEAHPAPWVLLVLAATVGLPFFVLASSAPLLQKWFAGTGRPSAQDPYYLYAASNLGSLAALLSYPILVEPFLGLAAQGWLVTAGYVGFVALTLACLTVLLTSPPPAAVAPEVTATAIQASDVVNLEAEGSSTAVTAELPFAPHTELDLPALAISATVTPVQRFFWVARAFVPSSLMLGVTMYMTTDLAPIPLLWILPLSLYLFSFVLAFSRMPRVLNRLFVLAMPLGILLPVLLLIAEARPESLWLTFTLHLGSLFLVATACHGELAQTRPSTPYLTEFYLWIALGGVLGGLFNAILAPLLFTRLAEYPVALVLAGLVLSPLTRRSPIRWLWLIDVGLMAILFVFVLGLLGLRTADPADSAGARLKDAFTIVPVGDLLWGAGLMLLWLPALLVTLILARQDRAGYAFDFALPLLVGLLTLEMVLQNRDKPEPLMVCLLGDLLALVVLVALMVIFALNRQWWRTLNFAVTALVSLLLVLLTLAALYFVQVQANMLDSTDLRSFRLATLGFPLLLTALAVDRPLRFGLCLGAVIFASTIGDAFRENIYVPLHEQRTFFGVLAVKDDGLVQIEPTGFVVEPHRLVHGTTLHGRQRFVRNEDLVAAWLSPLASSSALEPLPFTAAAAELLNVRREALTYYHRTGPVGEVIAELERRAPAPPIAVIGLGAGTIAGFGHPGQEITFYEIDPGIIRIARDPRYFTYLSDAEALGVRLNVIAGDGRLQLARAADGHFGLIVIDAFNSDAIPMHLITREALAGYRTKLAPGGVIAFHISNRYLDLESVLANLAHDAGVAALSKNDREDGTGKLSSHWVMIARRADDFGELPTSPDWRPPRRNLRQRLWTDDFSNLLGAWSN